LWLRMVELSFELIYSDEQPEATDEPTHGG
jgi:hypothetical protein